MRIPTVETCCCGFNLRLGSAIIGVFFFLSGLCQMISYSVQADSDDDVDNKGTYVTSAVLAAVMMCTSLILLFGVHKERHGLLKPWMIMYTVLTGISVILYFIGSIVFFATGYGVAGAFFLVLAFVIFLLYGYCLVVVYSYYLSLLGVQPGTV